MKRFGKLTGLLLSALFVILVATAVPSHSQKGGRTSSGLGSGSGRNSDSRDLFGSADDLSDDLDGSGSESGRRVRLRIRCRGSERAPDLMRFRIFSNRDPGYLPGRGPMERFGMKRIRTGSGRHR